MKVEVFRMNGKPVDKLDKEMFSKEFSDCFDAETKDGNPTDEEGWKALNDKLDKKEEELRAKYPAVKELSLVYMSQLEDFVKENGAVSVFIDIDGKLKIAINQE